MAELELPYVPIDPGIEDSERMDRFLELSGLHDDPMAPMRVVRFLLWVGRAHPDGNIGKMSARKIAKEMCWVGDPVKAREVMIESGWLVEDEEGALSVEGWDRHGGRVLQARNEHREREREKKKRQRCAKNGHPADTCECPGVVRDESPPCPPDVPGMSPERPPDVPVMKGEGRRVKGEDLSSSHKKNSRVKPVALGASPGAALIRSVKAVFDHWAKTHPGDFPQVHGGLREWSRILSLIRDTGLSVEQLKQAIDGFHLDDWAMQKNPTLWFCMGDPQKYMKLAAGKRTHGSDPHRELFIAVRSECVSAGVVGFPLLQEIPGLLERARGDPERILEAVRSLKSKPGEPPADCSRIAEVLRGNGADRQAS